MHRHALTDEQWERVQAIVPSSRTGPQSTRGDRLYVDAVLYRVKTGIPWRDLPERFGPWKTVYNRFNNWSRRGVWAKVFKAMQKKTAKRGCIVDGIVVRAHQDAAGEKGGSSVMLLVEVVEVLHDGPRARRHARSTSRSHKGTDTR